MEKNLTNKYIKKSVIKKAKKCLKKFKILLTFDIEDYIIGQENRRK